MDLPTKAAYALLRACLLTTLTCLGVAKAGSPQAPAAGQIISLQAYPNALCNDNTIAAYYFRPSTSGSTRWIFDLEGGDECHDDATCQVTRTNSYKNTTSIGWKVTKPQGIISTDPTYNPTFYDANTVKVHYCSSDYWSGAKMATTAFMPSNADSGWTFEGRAIAVAALTDVAAHASTNGFNAMTDILLTGSSAGGLGLVYIINDLTPLLPKQATKLLAIDAGFSLQIDSFKKNAPPTYMSSDNPVSDIVTAGITFWNGHGNTNCWKAATTEQEQETCYDTSQMLLNSNYVTKRAFIAQSELDTDQLSQHKFNGSITQDTAHTTYATEFVDAMKAALSLTSPPDSIFAPQRLTHDLMATNTEFSYEEVFGATTMSPAMALATWYANANKPFTMYGTQEGLP
jgi:hypothetical protein